MEVRDWITIATALIVATGWFVNSHLNRKHEIAKKKLEHRLNALQSYMPFAFSISIGEDPFKNDPQLIDKLRVAANNFQLYGTAEEIKMMDILVRAIETRDVDSVKKAHPALYDCVKKQLRKELGICS
jgi:hypothetical protein